MAFEFGRDLYDMPDPEKLCEELRAEIFERNNRLEAAERLLRKIRVELTYHDDWAAALINEIDTLLRDGETKR